MAYKSVRLLFREMNDWAVSWFEGRLYLSSKTNMAATLLTRQQAAKKLSFAGRKQASSIPEQIQWSFKRVDKRFPPAAQAAAVEMSRYWFNGRTTRDADLHLPHLFSLCPFTVTELMTSIDQQPWLRAWRKGMKGQMEGRTAVGKTAKTALGGLRMPSEWVRQSVSSVWQRFGVEWVVLGAFDLHVFCYLHERPRPPQSYGQRWGAGAGGLKPIVCKVYVNLPTLDSCMSNLLIFQWYFLFFVFDMSDILQFFIPNRSLYGSGFVSKAGLYFPVTSIRVRVRFRYEESTLIMTDWIWAVCLFYLGSSITTQQVKV